MISKIYVWILCIVLLALPVFGLSWGEFAVPAIQVGGNYIHEDFSIDNSGDWSLMSGSSTAQVVYDTENKTGRFTPCPGGTCNSLQVYNMYNGKRDMETQDGTIAFTVTTDTIDGDGYFHVYLSDTKNNTAEADTGFRLLMRYNVGSSDSINMHCFNSTDHTIISSSVNTNNAIPDINKKYLAVMHYNFSTVNLLFYDVTNPGGVFNPIYNRTITGCENDRLGNVTVRSYRQTGNLYHFTVGQIYVTDKVDEPIPYGSNLTANIMYDMNESYKSIDWYADGVKIDTGKDSIIVNHSYAGKDVHAELEVYVKSEIRKYNTSTYETEDAPNAPPVLSSGSFNQSSYTKNQDLSYWITASDSDSAAGNLTFEWYAGGSLVRNQSYDVNYSANVTDSLSYLYTTHDQNISLRIYSHDGEDWSAVHEDSIVTAQNSMPILYGGAFNQSVFNNIQDVRYWMSATDPDIQDIFINVTFEWYVDGGLVLNTTQNASGKPHNHSSEISYTLTSPGVNVSLVIYGYDGDKRSSAAEDSVIIPNIDPVLSAGCDDITIYHNVNLSCSYSVTDADHLSWSYHINDSRINLSSDGITATLTHDPVLYDYNVGDCWYIEVNVTDSVSWDSALFYYCIDDRTPVIDYAVASYYTLGDNLTIDVNVTDPEGDLINASYSIVVDGLLVKVADVENLSSGSVFTMYIDPDGYEDLDTIQINVTATDGVKESYLEADSVYRDQSHNLLSENYCPDDIPGMMLLLVVFIILAFFVVIDLMITFPILGVVAGIGFIGLGLVIIGCHSLMGFITSASGVLYIAYNAFIRDF